MRNLILVIGILVSFQVTAQSYDSYQKVKVGLFFSPTMSWIKPTNAETNKQKNRFGFSYGLLLDIRFTDNYMLHTGLTVGQLYGGKLRYTSGVADSSYSYKIDYLELPIVFKLMTNEIGAMKYWGQFGLVNSFRFKDQAKVVDNVSGEEVTPEGGPYGTGFYNISLQVGAGVEYNISGNTNLVLGLVYRNGFVNVINDNSVYPGKTFLHSLVLMTGVMF